MNCYSEKRRKSIVKEYVLKPIAHNKLLNSQIKRSCTGYPLVDSYYCFSYKSRIDEDDRGTFFCGIPAAEHFLSLLAHPKLPLFNPLASDVRPALSGDRERGAGNANETRKQVDPVTRQLLNAIQLLMVAWDVIPYGRLLDIKEKRIEYYYRPPFDDEVMYVNSIVSKDRLQRTLVMMIEELATSNELKHYEFDLLNAVLAKSDEFSLFG